MILKGIFTSVWDTDVEISTAAILDTETGEICTESVEAEDVDILEEEYFEDIEGNRYPVCPECHEFIVVTSMEDDEYISHQLNEVKRCKNPDCEYKELI